MESDPYQKLLNQKGGSGFPYLAILNANGDVMAKVDGINRHVEGFAASLESAKEFEALLKKAETGDLATKFKALMKQIDFRHFSAEEAGKRAAALEGLGTDQERELTSTITRMKVAETVATITRDAKTGIAAGKKFADMWSKGQVITDTSQREWIYFYYFIINYAESRKDAALFEKALEVVKEGDTGRYKRFITGMEKKLEALKSAGGN